MWQDEARQWLREVLPAERLDITVVRERAWGAIWAVTADAARYWFKRPHPSLWREVALRRRLEQVVPSLVLPVVADDASRGWMVTADQGPTLAARAREDGQHHYEELAEAMARVQRSVAAADLTGLDLPVFDPHDAVDRFDQLAGSFAALPADHPAHLSPAERDLALERLAAVVERWTRLEVEVPGLSVDHNDLHAGNAFPGPRISDWGDAVIGHPFCSLRALLIPARNTFGPEVVARVRRAYLAGFGEQIGDRHADHRGDHRADRGADGVAQGLDDGCREVPEPGFPATAALQEALDVAMMLAVPQRLNAWTSVQDETAWAEFADYITPLWREAGVPADRASMP